MYMDDKACGRMKFICTDILECLADHSAVVGGSSREEKVQGAELYLRDSFLVAGVDYGSPDPAGIKRVLKVLAAREIASGKDVRTVSANLIKIAQEL
jgi:hypothetical protein